MPDLILPMDITNVLLPFINEALRDFGPWAFLPFVLVMIGYEVRRKFLAKDAEIATLHHQIAELQEKRIQDAREMIRIAESGTAATNARTESDQRVADMLEMALRRNARGGLFGWRR